MIMVKMSRWGSPNLQYLDMGVAGQKGWETLIQPISLYCRRNRRSLRHFSILISLISSIQRLLCLPLLLVYCSCIGVHSVILCVHLLSCHLLYDIPSFCSNTNILLQNHAKIHINFAIMSCCWFYKCACTTFKGSACTFPWSVQVKTQDTPVPEAFLCRLIVYLFYMLLVLYSVCYIYSLYISYMLYILCTYFVKRFEAFHIKRYINFYYYYYYYASLYFLLKERNESLQSERNEILSNDKLWNQLIAGLLVFLVTPTFVCLPILTIHSTTSIL